MNTVYFVQKIFNENENDSIANNIFSLLFLCLLRSCFVLIDLVYHLIESLSCHAEVVDIKDAKMDSRIASRLINIEVVSLLADSTNPQTDYVSISKFVCTLLFT